MKEKEILEGNKLIAEFMGVELYNGNVRILCTNGDIDYDACYPLLYDSSFDWLIPVIDKISMIKGVYITMAHSSFTIYHFGRKAFNASGSDRLTNAFNLAVSFIKWHNENKR